MVDVMKVAMFLVTVDLMLFAFMTAIDETPAGFRGAYSQFVDINVDDETINRDDTAIGNVVNTETPNIVAQVGGFIFGTIDWFQKVITLIAWLAGSMLLMPLTILQRLQLPFIVQLVIGVPAIIMQIIILVSAISGRALHK